MAAPAPADESNGAPASDVICIALQAGAHKQYVNLDRNVFDQRAMVDALRSKALLVLQQRADAAKELAPDAVMLFRHDYGSHNLLTVVDDGAQLHHGSVVEAVLAARTERPTRPHILGVNNYKTPTFCDFCGEILVGLVRQGLRCSKCALNFHKKCAFAPFNNCPSNQESDEPPVDGQLSFGLPHTFVVHSYKKPTVCKVCEKMLLGLAKQGLQCRDCKVNTHKRCAAALPHDCRPSSGYFSAVSQTSTISEKMDTSEADATSSADGRQPAEERISTGDMIPLARIPGQASSRQSRPPAAPLEGWMMHFTNHQPDRRLRHYWLLEPGAINMYNEGLHRSYKTIPLSSILGLHVYEGKPLDEHYPPHCFEIQTAHTIYYVGENLDWYAAQVGGGGGDARAVKLPRRESGVGLASAQKWLAALRQALLPPPTPREPAGAVADYALSFSQLYQVNQQELGSGQFGTVYCGVHRQSGREVAVKVIAKERFGRKQRDQLQSEVAILQSVSHPGIIRLESMFETTKQIFVVMEKMQADMLEMILSSRLGRLSERITKFLLVQILAALRYLHTKDIAHCDLKPENVLLSSSDTDFPQTKLCDFGYARIIEEAQFRKTVVGTPAYLAPEVLQKRGYNKSLDMWSVGVIIYVTLSGTFPFNEGEEISDQIQNAAFMYPANPWSEISTSAVDLISRLLKVQIEARLTIEECLVHEWLNDAQTAADTADLERRVGVRYLADEL